MYDQLDQMFERFFDTNRTPKQLHGLYRAQVVETNDPLQMNRVRVRCPDLHDSNLGEGDCPWVIQAPGYGGFRCGSWVSPVIGDFVWLDAERGHPYGLVMVGFASPTRRKAYPLPAVAGPTPLSVNIDGSPADRPHDFHADFLPQDGRPMSQGTVDRYGNMDVSSAIGFFPSEHAHQPPPAGFDPLQGRDFFLSDNPPAVNDPDVKHMSRITKYGHMFIMGDQGYWWQASDDDPDYGEFTGDIIKDEEFEVARWKSILEYICEGEPNGRDQRRIELRTRYGHKRECRDVGWAQPGPQPSKSRDGEFAGSPKYLSREEERDERWIKDRTKAGMLFQMMDSGADPAEDQFIKRPLMQELGTATEKEDVYWKNKDARQIRLVTRYGLKIALDDRGSSSTNADIDEVPRGNGIIIKGRRTPTSHQQDNSGNPRGFYFEFNENDQSNHLTIGSPLGSAFELNDDIEYVILCTGLGKDYAMPWKGIQENEFLRKPVRAMEALKKTHHLLLDHENEMIRLKSRSGHGALPDFVVEESAGGGNAINQGLEIRDGISGDSPWVELVDMDDRGLWLSRGQRLAILRGSKETRQMIALAEIPSQITDPKTGKLKTIYTSTVIIDNPTGKIQIHARDPIEFTTTRGIHFKADAGISFEGGQAIVFQGESGRMTLDHNGLAIQGNMRCNEMQGHYKAAYPGKGAGKAAGWSAKPQQVDPPKLPEHITPTDRGQTFNEPTICPDDVIEPPLRYNEPESGAGTTP